MLYIHGFYTALTGLHILFHYDMPLNANIKGQGFNIANAVLFYVCVDVKFNLHLTKSFSNTVYQGCYPQRNMEVNSQCVFFDT